MCRWQRTIGKLTVIQPPVTYLKPNSQNRITDNFAVAHICNVTNQLTSNKVEMTFMPTIGNTFTQAFSIPYNHLYLQVKFNAIVSAQGTSPISPALLINILSSTGQTIYTILKSFTVIENNPVACDSSYFAHNVFFVN